MEVVWRTEMIELWLLCCSKITSTSDSSWTTTSFPHPAYTTHLFTARRRRTSTTPRACVSIQNLKCLDFMTMRQLRRTWMKQEHFLIHWCWPAMKAARSRIYSTRAIPRSSSPCAPWYGSFLLRLWTRTKKIITKCHSISLWTEEVSWPRRVTLLT